MPSIQAFFLILGLLCLSFPLPGLSSQALLPPSTCDNTGFDAQLKNEIIPKLQLLQQILDKNFSTPPRAPSVDVVYNATQNSVAISISNVGSFSQAFQVSYFAEVSGNLQPNVVTAIVPAIQGGDFVFRGAMVLSASSNFVPSTRYFFSAMARVLSLNQQSSPSPLHQFDFLPTFVVDPFTSTISADSTPLSIDVITRYFPKNAYITLTLPAPAVSVNLTFIKAPDSSTGRPSNVFIARITIPALSIGGTYNLLFVDVTDGITITRSLQVLPPFRPVFRSISPSSVPLAGTTVRILLTNVTYPLVAATTKFAFQNSPSVFFAAADSIDHSSSGPLDFFVTFRLPNVSSAGTVSFVVVPNNQVKAIVHFSVLYTAVRLIGSLPTSYFFPRIGVIRVTVAVDVGTATVSSVSFTGAAKDKYLSISARMLSVGVHEYTLQLADSLAVGSYQGTLSIQSNDIHFPVNVVAPPAPTIALDPATIYDDGSSIFPVSVSVQNIGDIVSSRDLHIFCSSTASVCSCTVASFSLSFALINCNFRGPLGQISVTVNNTNVIGYGLHIVGSLTVAASTAPRILAVSTDTVSQLGRLPVAVAVTNFVAINYIKVGGVQHNAASNFFLTLPVIRPFTSDQESQLGQIVKQMYPQEPIFSDALSTIVTRLQSSLSYNATIVLFRMPKVSSASIAVEIGQSSPSASVSVNLLGVALSGTPSVTTSVSKISIQGGTSVIMSLKQYIPITQQQDIEIICMIRSGLSTANVSISPTLVRATTSDASFQFQSPALNSTVDVHCVVVSRIDSLLGIVSPSPIFVLTVFDPRSLALIDSSQRSFYTSGGPRVLSINLIFLKVVPVSAQANLIDCKIISSPTSADVALNADAVQNVRIVLPDFNSNSVGDINVVLMSGSEQVALTVSLIAAPTTPTLLSIQGNTAIPSKSNKAVVTATFQQFIASANTSSLMVFVPALANFSVSSVNVFSDFQRTVVSFPAPQLIGMGTSESTRTLDAFVADFSSACGRNLTCVGRFTLQYSNIDLVSFLTMTPTSGPPSVPTLVTILLANVKTANTSFVTASVGDSQKANVLVQVIGASFGGEGLSSQTVITIRISWVGNPRPAVSSVALALTIVLDQQTVAIPTAFTVLPDNQPQFLSLSPSSTSIFGGRHVAVFIQPAAFGFRSVSVAIDGVSVLANFSATGDLIYFNSLRVPGTRTSTVIFSLVGASSNVTLSSQLFYTDPPAVIVKSVFPSQFSSFGSSSQVQLVDVPSFWSSASVVVNLVQGTSSTPCGVLALARSSTDVIMSISCPSSNPGFGFLELFDSSATSQVARSLPLSIVSPTALQFVSILPSQYFLSKSTQMSVTVKNFPIGGSPKASFSRQAPLPEIPATILSTYFEPSNSSTTLATLLVNSPTSVSSFAVIVSATAANGAAVSCTSPFFSVIDDSAATVLSVKPSSIQSIGGSVEVIVLGFPPSLVPSGISASFSVMSSFKIAEISSCSYDTLGRAIVVVSFSSFDITSSALLTVTLKPQNFESKSVSFQVNVMKVFPSIASVTPSLISDIGGDRLLVRMPFFPVITSVNFVSVSIGGIASSLTVSFVSSSPDITTIQLQTPYLNISASGTFQLLVNYIIAPTLSLSSLVSIQLTSKASLVPPIVPFQVFANSTVVVPFTLAFPAFDFNKFNDFAVGSSFNSRTVTPSGENLCFSVFAECSDIGCLVQESGVTNYRILSKNVPYKGCIAFGAQFAAKAVAGKMDLSVKWHPLCSTQTLVGSESVVVVTTSMSLSPSSGAVSGGYLVTMSILGVPSITTGTAVYFGNALAVVSSQTTLGSTLVLSVICPASTSASSFDVSIRAGNSILVASTFTYVLGCLDYVAFCGGLKGGFIAKIVSIANDPPSASECLQSYCIATSSISAPVLVSFPSKQMTSISTISFSVRNFFVVTGSQIRVTMGMGNILLPVLSSSYVATSDSFSITAQSPVVSASSANTIFVYSAVTGPSLNASFVLTSLVPISGPIQVVSLLPSIIPFEGSSSYRLSLSNFPYNASVPVVTFAVIAHYQNISLVSSVQSSDINEFGIASAVLTLKPSSIFNFTVNTAGGLLVNVTVQAVGFAIPNSVSFQVEVRPRLNRRISSISAANALSSSNSSSSIALPPFRSIAGTVVSVSVEGFEGPDVTVCFGFKSLTPNRNHQSCTIEEQNCVISRGSVVYGDRVSTISIPYTREFFSFLKSTATVADLTVLVSDFARLDACSDVVRNNAALNSRAVECGISTNVKCLEMIPPNTPALQSSPPSSVAFITVQSPNIFTGSVVFLTFSNFFDSKDSVSAGIGSDSGPNAFAKIQDGCTFASCRISAIVGGNPSDASLVGSALIISVRARNITIPVTIPKIVVPSPLVLPSLISASGGATISVSSFAFSRTNASTQYTVSNPAFSILEVSKVGNFTTVFRIRLVTPLSVGTLSLSIRSISSTVITQTFELEIFPAVTLNNPAISGCLAGDRRVQISVSNLPVSLGSVDVLAVTFNNLPRPVVIVSSATLNFTFPCDEITSSEVSLSISATVFGSAREASTLINVPTLSLIMSLIVGTSRFPLASSSQLAVQASTLCSSNAAARSNSRCRTATVNTQLSPGAYSLDVFPLGSSTPAQSLTIFVISSSSGSSLFSFIFDPAAETTPPGLYNLMLTAQSRTTSMAISVFDPVSSAICLGVVNDDGAASDTCSINANVGGVVSLRLVNFAFGLMNAADLAFSIAKIDGTPVSSLKPQLTVFSSIDKPFILKVNKYTVNSDFSNGQMAVLLNVALISSPATSISMPIVLRLDPQVVSVDFSESLVSLTVSMNQPVVPKVTPTSCSLLFSNATLGRFGSSPVCRFSSASAIFVQFGNDESIVTGDILSILPGSIVPADRFPISNVALFPAVAAVPSAFKKPPVEIKGSQYVEGCGRANPAFLYAIANSPRPFVSVTWSCPACSTDAMSLTEFLSSARKLSVTIPAANIQGKCTIGAQCGIVVTVEDFLGRSSVSVPFFLYAETSSVPDLQFLPLDHERYTPDMAVVLRTRFKFSACYGNTESIPIFSWSISPSSAANVSSITSPRLLLPPNSLPPGSYTVTATASLDGASASAAIPFRIAPRGIFASVSAPNFVSSSSNIVLDASRSRHLEISIRPTPTLLFSWTCTYQNQPCLSSAGTRLLLPQKSSSDSTITILANALTLGITADQSAKFVFTVSVSNSADQREPPSSSVAEVSIVLDAIPTIVAAASSYRVNSGSTFPVGLSAAVISNQPNLVVVWSEFSGLLPGGISSVLDSAFNVRSSTIVINPSLFVPGPSYVFQAVVENNPRATATVSISVNPAPSSGKCFVASVETGAVSTPACRSADKCSVLSRVTVSCENWMDDDLPLAYQVGYRSASGSEIRFDYIRESSSSFRLPIGSQNLFVDVCDSNFACSTFTSFSENPMNISAVILDDQQQKDLTNEISKSAQSGDVDAFSSVLGAAISYFLPTTPLPTPNRRLLADSQFIIDTAKQISAFATKLGSNNNNVDIGASNSLIQQASNLAQAARSLDGVSSASLLSSLTTLGSSFSTASSSSQIKTAATACANILSSVSNADALKLGTNFQDVKKVEMNTANALLKDAQPGQFKDASSADSGYAIRVTSVVFPAKSQRSASTPVSILAPSPTASTIEFVLPELNVIDGSSVSVRSSFVPKAKYATTVTQGGLVLMSDVADCTVAKGVNSQPIKTGDELKIVNIKIPFTLSDSGAGSAAALAADPSSFKIYYYDETVVPPVWKTDEDCSGNTVLSGGPKSAVFQGTCNHLTTFGIIAGPPGTGAGPGPGPQPGPINQTKPQPDAKPVDAPSEAPAEFPLWAIILIPVVGGISLLSAGGFLVYKRIHNVRVRAKQIVAASEWKSHRSATTISKLPRPSANVAKADNVGTSGDGSPKPEQQPVAKLAQVSKPVASPSKSATPPSVTSLTTSSSVKSRRQELANLAAADAANAVEFQMRQPALSPAMSSQQHAQAASRRVPFTATASTSPERRRNISPVSSDTRSNLSSASLRRQQLADLVLEQSTRAPISQISPTRLPSRMSPSSTAPSREQSSPHSASPHLSQGGAAMRSRSASRHQREAASPFFAERSPEPRVSPNVSQAAALRTRSPLPSSRTRAISPLATGRAISPHATGSPLPSSRTRAISPLATGRAISPLATGRLGPESPSLHSSRFGSANFERYQSQSPPTSRAYVSPTYARAPSVVPSTEPRSTSRPGFRKPSSPQQDSGSRYDQA